MLISTNLLNCGTSLTVAKEAGISVEGNLFESNLILEQDSELGEIYYVLDDDRIQECAVIDFLDIAIARGSRYELYSKGLCKNYSKY